MNRQVAMALVDRIRKAAAAAVQPRCEDKGCDCRFEHLNRCVILKGEVIKQDRKMCDCIVFCANRVFRVVLVELKSKTVEPAEVQEKLQNGANAALEILDQNKENGRVTYERRCFVLARSWHTSDFRVITRRRIRFGGIDVPIEVGRCGFCLRANG